MAKFWSLKMHKTGNIFKSFVQKAGINAPELGYLSTPKVRPGRSFSISFCPNFPRPAALSARQACTTC